MTRSIPIPLPLYSSRCQARDHVPLKEQEKYEHGNRYHHHRSCQSGPVAAVDTLKDDQTPGNREVFFARQINGWQNQLVPNADGMQHDHRGNRRSRKRYDDLPYKSEVAAAINRRRFIQFPGQSANVSDQDDDPDGIYQKE